MSPEDEAYIKEHDLDALIQAIMMAMLRSKPSDPINFLMQKLEKRIKRQEGGAKPGSRTGRRGSTIYHQTTSGRGTPGGDIMRRGSSQVVLLNSNDNGSSLVQPMTMSTGLGDTRESPTTDSEWTLAKLLGEEDMLPLVSTRDASPPSPSSQHILGMQQHQQEPEEVSSQKKSVSVDQLPNEEDNKSMVGGGIVHSHFERDIETSTAALSLLGDDDAEAFHGQAQLHEDEEDHHISSSTVVGESIANNLDHRQLSQLSSRPTTPLSHGPVTSKRRHTSLFTTIVCPNCGATVTAANRKARISNDGNSIASLWANTRNAIRFTTALQDAVAARRGAQSDRSLQEVRTAGGRRYRTGRDLWGRARTGITKNQQPGLESSYAGSMDNDISDDFPSDHVPTIRLSNREKGRHKDVTNSLSGVATLLAARRRNKPIQKGKQHGQYTAALSTTRGHRGFAGVQDDLLEETEEEQEHERMEADQPVLNYDSYRQREDENDDFIEDSVYGDAFPSVRSSTLRNQSRESHLFHSTKEWNRQREKMPVSNHSELVSTWKAGASTVRSAFGNRAEGDLDDGDAMSIATGVDADDELEAFFRTRNSGHR
eukprot:gene5927-249_t